MAGSLRDEGSDAVVWTNIVLTGLPELRCTVRVTEAGLTLDSAGEPLPLAERLLDCGENGSWMVGRLPVCAKHAAEVAALLRDDLGVIFTAWCEENGIIPRDADV